MKTYLVVTETVRDYEASTNYRSFIIERSARQYLLEEVESLEKWTDADWEVEDNREDGWYEAYPAGYYAQDHCLAKLLEVELEGYIDLKVDAIKEEEQKRFYEVASELEFTKREDGREVYTLPEEDEDGYDPRPIILASYDDGADNVRVDAIIRNGDYYHLECSDTQSFEDFCFDLDDIECGHLDYLTNSL